VYGLTYAGEMEFVYKPANVYPKGEENYDPAKVVSLAWRQHNLERASIYAVKAVDDATRAAQAEWEAAWNRYNDASSIHTDELDVLIIKAITGPAADFEKNYQAYLDVVKSPEIVATLDTMYETWMRYFKLRQKFLVKLK
jgi:hypothetical protein